MSFGLPPFPIRTVVLQGTCGLSATKLVNELDFTDATWYMQVHSVAFTKLPANQKLLVAISSNWVNTKFRLPNGKYESEEQILFTMQLKSEAKGIVFNWCPPTYFRVTSLSNNLTFNIKTLSESTALEKANLNICVYFFKKY